LFVMYDENDGFFDHVVPPTPPRTAADGASTVDASDEIYAGDPDHPSGPYGLGVRVPMIVVSPWSKGGYVCSEVFDHTSLIRFLERRFAPHHPDLIETNITQWRRTVCGDLTSAFDFSNSRAAPVELPDTSSYMPLSHERFPDYVPEPPNHQSLPKQERGLRRARALPYALDVDANVLHGGSALRLEFKNRGKAGACFQVRSGTGSQGPWTYTVEAGKSLANKWELGASHGKYDFTVHGPNGFLRRFRGKAAHGGEDLDVDVHLDVRDYTLVVRVTNETRETHRVRIEDAYGERTFTDVLPRGRALEKRLSLKSSYGWYDVAIRTGGDDDFLRRAAGHLENGEDSASDPAFGTGP